MSDFLALILRFIVAVESIAASLVKQTEHLTSMTFGTGLVSSESSSGTPGGEPSSDTSGGKNRPTKGQMEAKRKAVAEQLTAMGVLASVTKAMADKGKGSPANWNSKQCEDALAMGAKLTETPAATPAADTSGGRDSVILAFMRKLAATPGVFDSGKPNAFTVLTVQAFEKTLAENKNPTPELTRAFAGGVISGKFLTTEEVKSLIQTYGGKPSIPECDPVRFMAIIEAVVTKLTPTPASTPDAADNDL